MTWRSAALAVLALGLIGSARAQQQEIPVPPILLPEVPPNASRNDPYIRMVPVKDKQGHIILQWWGEIKRGDAVRFQAAMGMVKPVEVYFLGSPGGVMTEGMEMARIIHRAKISTHIPKGTECISACNFVFMGGIVREIDEGGQFITHMYNLREAPTTILKDIYGVLDAEKKPDETKPAEPQPPSSPERPQEAKLGALIPSQLLDTAGKFAPPKNLKSLGCEIEKIYSEDYEHAVQLAEATLEGQNITDQDIIQGKKDVPIKNQQQLAMLRALTLDYLCLEQGAATAATDIAFFVIEMRLSLKFLRRMTDIANALPKPLTPQELVEYNIVNLP